MLNKMLSMNGIPYDEEEDPRAVEPCPLGLQKDGREHDPQTEDNHVWKCACGAWQKGTLIMLPEHAAANVDDRILLISDRQLLSAIAAGMPVDPEVHKACKQRLHARSQS